MGALLTQPQHPTFTPNDWLGKGKQMSDPNYRRRVGFRKAQAGARQAEYWRKRWKTHPETMRSNLEALNRTRKEKAEKRTAVLKVILGNARHDLLSWELKPELEAAIVKSGYTLKPNSVKLLIAALRRRNLISFDHSTLRWRLIVA